MTRLAGVREDWGIPQGGGPGACLDRPRSILNCLGAWGEHFSALRGESSLLLAATLAAFLGSFIGARLMKKVTLKAVQRLVAILLFVLGGAIATGLV